MKYFLIVVFVVVFVSCGETETVYNYPDGIAKPDHVIQSYGCGNIFVYQFMDSLKALTVRINPNELV